MQALCDKIFVGDKMDMIIRQIGTISRALDTIANIEFKDLGVAKGQYVHLVRIDENPGITLRQLSNITYIDETTCSRSVNKLETNGLIYKQTAEDNKKNKLLYLTEKGQGIVAAIYREHDYTNMRMVENLSAEERVVLTKLLGAVAEPVLADYNQVRKHGKREY